MFLWGGGGLHGVQYGSKRHLRDVLPQVCGLLLPQRQPAGDAGCGPAVARAGGSVLRCRCTGRGWAGLYEGWVGGCVVEQGRWPSFRLAVLPPFSHHDDSVACCPPPSCSADWLHMPTATCPRWTSACAPPSRYGSRACCWVTVERSCARVGSCAGAAAGSVARRTAAMHTRNAALAPPLLCSSLHLIFPPPPPLCPQLGALAEFRSDWAAALRMYGEAAGYIPQLLAAAGGAQPQRYAEVRAVAEQMHIKVSWQGGRGGLGVGLGGPLLCMPAACCACLLPATQTVSDLASARACSPQPTTDPPAHLWCCRSRPCCCWPSTKCRRPWLSLSPTEGCSGGVGVGCVCVWGGGGGGGAQAVPGAWHAASGQPCG